MRAHVERPRVCQQHGRANRPCQDRWANHHEPWPWFQRCACDHGLGWTEHRGPVARQPNFPAHKNIQCIHHPHGIDPRTHHIAKRRLIAELLGAAVRQEFACCAATHTQCDPCCGLTRSTGRANRNGQGRAEIGGISAKLQPDGVARYGRLQYARPHAR